MKPDQNRMTGIKDIAEVLGISIGTVDRALHARPGVSPVTRAKVLAVAEKLRYKPNIAARSLKLSRSLRIAVYLPEEIASYFDPIRAGIQAAAAATTGVLITLDFRNYLRLGEGVQSLLEKDLAKNYDGIIVVPGNPRQIDPILRKFDERGTAIVCLSSDAPNSPHLVTVCADAYACGCIAAELLTISLGQRGSVAVITGSLKVQNHAEKVRGFAATLAVMAPRLQLLAVVESHDQTKVAYRETAALLKQNPGLNGLYISTANSISVMQAIEDHGSLGRIRVVATDLFPELISQIESGNVLATIHQRPFTQGKVAFESLLRFLTERTRPKSSITRLAPHIVLRSNLSLFSDPM